MGKNKKTWFCPHIVKASVARLKVATLMKSWIRQSVRQVHIEIFESIHSHQDLDKTFSDSRSEQARDSGYIDNLHRFPCESVEAAPVNLFSAWFIWGGD